MMRRLLVVLAVAGAGSGCGYFNSLYNANRQYAEAERAAARGEVATSRTAYLNSIDKAAVSYRSYPDGRWSDDALLLIGRARFALGDDEEAAAAMRHLLARSMKPASRAIASAYLGAALVRMDSVADALPHLDSAAGELKPSTHSGAFARLWRGRAAFEQGHATHGFADLDVAAAHPATAAEAAFEMARRAVALRDSARLVEAATRLAATRDAERLIPELETLLRSASLDWSAATVLHATEPFEHAVWRADAANRIGMERADMAVRAGDRPRGIQIVMNIAQSTSGGAGSRARVRVVRWRFADAHTLEELDDAQRLLLVALDNADAIDLLRSSRAVQLLAARGSTSASSLSLFAAAELAQDLRAPWLARRLFLDFVALVPDSPWAGKAALAAHAIAADTTTAALLAQLHANPYVRAVSAGPGGAAGDDDLTLAEQRLARGIAGLRADALAEVVLRDVGGVGRALSQLDSARASARSDSVRIACGSLVDSLAIRGQVADSLRTACLRGDSARVGLIIRGDTAALRDSAQSAAARANPVQLPPDTLPPPQ